MQSAEGIIEAVRAAGICGLGGGRFDTATKLQASRGAHTLLINGMQSEPGNLSDTALLQEDPDTVIAGAGLAAQVSRASQLILALPAEPKLPKATTDTLLAAMNNELTTLARVRDNDSESTNGSTTTFVCRFLPASHATGQELLLAKALGVVGETQSNQIPSSMGDSLREQGVLCLNIATAYAIARAVNHNEPLTQRMVTVAGEPRRLELGIPLSDILQGPVWVNGHHGGDWPAEQNLHAGIFCLDPAPPDAHAPCINCGACVPVCPANLRPDDLHRSIDLGAQPGADQNLPDCIECGACNAVCPSGLWLAQEFRAAKKLKHSIEQNRLLAEQAKARSDARTNRLAKAQARRAERLKERSAPGKRQW